MDSAHHGRSQVQVGALGLQDVDAQARGLPVSAAGHHGRSRRQAGPGRGAFVDQRQHRPRRGHVGQLRGVELQYAQDLFRPRLGAHVEEPERVGARATGGPASGEAPHQVCVNVREHGCLRVPVGLMMEHPGEPVCDRGHVDGLAGDFVDAARSHRFAQPRHFGARALIQPHDCGAHGVAGGVDWHEGLALIGDRDCRDATRPHAIHDSAQRRAGGAPPFAGVLLIPVGRRAREANRAAALRGDCSRPSPGDRLGGGGAAVEANDQVAVHPISPACGGHTPQVSRPGTLRTK